MGKACGETCLKTRKKYIKACGKETWESGRLSLEYVVGMTGRSKTKVGGDSQSIKLGALGAPSQSDPGIGSSLLRQAACVCSINSCNRLCATLMIF